jgi:hypothetical protein
VALHVFLFDKKVFFQDPSRCSNITEMCSVREEIISRGGRYEAIDGYLKKKRTKNYLWRELFTLNNIYLIFITFLWD